MASRKANDRWFLLLLSLTIVAPFWLVFCPDIFCLVYFATHSKTSWRELLTAGSVAGLALLGLPILAVLATWGASLARPNSLLFFFCVAAACTFVTLCVGFLCARVQRVTLARLRVRRKA